MKFVIQTPQTYNPQAPSAARGTGSAIVGIHGPFTDEQEALSFVEELNLNGLAGNSTYEFLIDAEEIVVSVECEVDRG